MLVFEAICARTIGTYPSGPEVAVILPDPRGGPQQAQVVLTYDPVTFPEELSQSGREWMSEKFRAQLQIGCRGRSRQGRCAVAGYAIEEHGHIIASFGEHPHLAPFCVKTPWAGWS